MADRRDLLLAAGLELASELSLPVVLQRIVDLAAEVAEARYGALGVVGGDGRITDFITTGLSSGQREAIGTLPHGEGILGALIKDARPLRLDRIADDPRSAGFPPNHPPMGSFLGAPVKALGRVFGNIYLTEKRGDVPFTEADEEALVLLAAQAGVAIANASLYEEARHRERWLEGLNEITGAILAGGPLPSVLELACRHVRDLVGADLATVVTRTGRPGVLELVAADGDHPDNFVGMAIPEGHSISGDVIRTGHPVVLTNAGNHERAFQPMVRVGGMGHWIFLPLRAGKQAFGTLSVAHKLSGRPFSDEEARLLASFADQVSIGFEYARARADAERLAILDDRERIAKELHDGIIQSLFAVGMGLQGAATISAEEQTAGRIELAVEEIDRVIRDLRNYIFGLRPGILADRQLDQALRQLAGEVGEKAGISVEVDVDPDVAARLASQASDVIQLAREALSNTSRHAQARSLRLKLSGSGRAAVLEIVDDGRGFDPRTVRAGQGLGNLRTRARALQGTARITSAPGRGTKVRITLPL